MTIVCYGKMEVEKQNIRKTHPKIIDFNVFPMIQVLEKD